MTPRAPLPPRLRRHRRADDRAQRIASSMVDFGRCCVRRCAQALARTRTCAINHPRAAPQRGGASEGSSRPGFSATRSPAVTGVLGSAGLPFNTRAAAVAMPIAPITRPASARCCRSARHAPPRPDHDVRGPSWSAGATSRPPCSSGAYLLAAIAFLPLIVALRLRASRSSRARNANLRRRVCARARVRRFSAFSAARCAEIAPDVLACKA
jgi:hypothetical protein